MSHRNVFTRHAFAAAFLLAAAVACNDNSTDPPVATAVNATSAVTITGVAGETLSQPLTVRVVDSQGRAVGGTTVTFAVVEGAGTVTPASVQSSSTGDASTVWRLGDRSGAQRVTATVAGVTTPVTFVATVGAAAPATVAITAGDNQTAAAGALVANAPSVVVRDRFTNPVSGVSVVFSVLAGNGSVVTPGAITNASGVATVEGWRLGTTAGANRLQALVVASGVTANPVVFSATGTSGAAATIAPQTTTTINVPVSTAVTPAPSVRVTDASGNGVSGVTVTFTGSAGSTVTGGTKTTDANGVATVDSWLLGAAAGTYTLTATSGNLTAAVFTATARAGTAASVSVFAGNNQSAIVGRTVAVEPSVRVVDAQGNPVAGVEVVFDVTLGGGTAVARRPLTNANGVAEVGGWTLGEEPGTNRLRATVTGTNIAGNPITFTATGTPGLPASVTAVSGNGQTATANQAVTTPPSVIVRDNRGNPVNGVTVTFLIGSGAGTVLGATQTTAGGGVATVERWTLGPAAGQQTLIARVQGLPDVTFTATATPGTPANVVALSITNLGNVTVNGMVLTLPSVRVRDANNNPVSGAVVTFTPEGTGNTLTGATVTTGADGIATLGSWQIGTVATTYRVRAFVANLDQGGNEPTFTVIGTAGNAVSAQVASSSVQSQSAVASAAVTTTPVVRVLDQFGNGVANISVTWTVGSGTSTVSGGLSTVNVVTDNLGFASVGSWTMGTGSGTRTLTALVQGNSITGNPVTFTAIVQ